MRGKKWRRCGQLDATMPELAGVICPKTAPSIVAVLLCFHAALTGHAQTVEILAADQISRDPQITEAQRLIGNVKLGHQDAVLSCDSAWRFEGGRVEIFGEVRMNQPPSTTMQSQHLVIQPGEDWVAASGNVVFNHESSRLEAPSISYSIPNRQAKYVNGASIYEEDWNIISQSGTYWATDELLHLGGNIMAIQETDTLWSDSLHWNRLDDRYSFLGHSLWKGAEMSFECHQGDIRFQGNRPEGWLSGGVWVSDSRGEVVGDSLTWRPPLSEVWGNVQLIGEGGDAMAIGEYAQRSDEDVSELVLGNDVRPAWIRQVDNQDTLYLSALRLTRQDGELMAENNVIIEQRDIRGVGDSLHWINDRGLIRVWGQPQMWTDQDQMTGDTLILMLEEQKPTMLQLRGHAVVLSPANDSLAHRVQGRDLDAVFDEGALSEVHVVGNGEVTTFDVPEKGVLGNIRINSALCASLVMTIRDQKLTGINLQQHPRGTIQTVNSNTPLDAFHIEVFPANGPWETWIPTGLPE